MAKISLDRNRSKGTISRYIYGSFAEHLGRCIYSGIFVGKDSPIPNVNGMRTDVVEAMKNLKMPVLRWPGEQYCHLCLCKQHSWSHPEVKTPWQQIAMFCPTPVY